MRFFDLWLEVERILDQPARISSDGLNKRPKIANDVKEKIQVVCAERLKKTSLVNRGCPVNH
jgi:BMFP domain-containing protein YqiC